MRSCINRYCLVIISCIAFSHLIFSQSTPGVNINESVIPTEQYGLLDSLLGEKKYDELDKIINDYLVHHTTPDSCYSNAIMDLHYRKLEAYIFQEKYSEVEPYLLQYIASLEKYCPEKQQLYGKSLSLAATLYKRLSQFEKSLDYSLKAVEVIKNAFGTSKLEYADILNNTGVLLFNQNQFEKAEKFLLQSLAVYKIEKNNNQSGLSACLNNLGLLNKSIGKYKEAEQFFLLSLKVKKQEYGRHSSQYAGTLNNLGILFLELGDYSKASGIFSEAISVYEALSLFNSQTYAKFINNIGYLCLLNGDFLESEVCLNESLFLRKKLFTIDHVDHAASFHNLGLLYSMKGNYEMSQFYFKEALRIRRDLLGNVHRETAKSLIYLGRLYMHMGNLTDAEYCLQEAEIILNKLFSSVHPDHAHLFATMGSYYFSARQYDKAMHYWSKMSESQKSFVKTSQKHLSETEMEKLLYSLHNETQMLFSAAKDINKPEFNEILANQLLFYKGRLLENAYHLQLQASRDSSLTEIYSEWKFLHRKISAEFVKPPGERVGENKLLERAIELEKQLIRVLPGMDDFLADIMWRDVQNCLLDGELVIEFIHFMEESNIRYAAIAFNKESHHPVWIPLSTERELSQNFMPGPRKSDYANQLYGVNNRQAQGFQPVYGPARGIKELILFPLAQSGMLRGIKHIYYSPTGLLHKIQLGAIPVSDTSGLVLQDVIDVTAIHSSRRIMNDTLRTSLHIKKDAMLIGGVDFKGSSPKNGEAKETKTEFDILTLIGQPNGQRNLGNRHHLPDLPHTTNEVQTIARILKENAYNVSLYTGSQATESEFKRRLDGTTPSPRIVHIATHGYFFEDIDTKKNSDILSEAPIWRFSEQPMLRSGVLLAGAEYAWNQYSSGTDLEDDGILTALEISRLNMNQTELVILSACDTGLGAISNSEGVYGLQRAFRIAGVKNIIVSHWEVNDADSKYFMTAFYRKWQEQGMSIHDAFYATQKELRRLGGSHPYVWASFTLLE